jgi:hypothetical protein
VKALALLAFALAGIHVGTQRVVPFGESPSWSPNGVQLAFASRGELWIADADGSQRVQLARGDRPAWSPDGRHIAFERDGLVRVIGANGTNDRSVARGGNATWTPDGRRIAFDFEGETSSVLWTGGGLRDVAPGEDPAYARDGRLAVVQDGQVLVGGAIVAEGYAPSFAADGRLAYIRDDTIMVAEQPLGPGHQPAWRPPVSAEPLPDLDQRAPSRLGFLHDGRGRWKLGFQSAVVNLGPGPLDLVASRRAGEHVMHASQRVGARTYARAGVLRYVQADNHVHWHFLPFEVYELRSADGRLVVRDHKSGFCMADHHRARDAAPPHFLGDCASHQPEAMHVEEGTSVGYVDIYPAHFHGQNLDVTHVPAGVYVLVHRVNPRLQVREVRYTNDAASLRIRLAWHDGTPSVRVLRTCESSATCEARSAP